MRMVIEIVVLAALVIVLTALPGHAQERSTVKPTATTLAAPPEVQRAAFDAFLFIDGIPGETDDSPGGGGGGGSSEPHCYEDEEQQMSICE